MIRLSSSSSATAWSLQCCRGFSRKILSTSLRRQSNQAVKQEGRWNIFAWYNNRLEKYPITTKCLTSAVLYGLGDVIAQNLTSFQEAFDTKRCLRAVVYGAVVMAPLSHVHFNFLEWFVVTKMAVRASVAPIVKMLIDQFGYFSPSMMAIYHLSMGAMEGLSYDDTMKRLKELYWPSLKACWTVWPIFLVVNFKLVPVPHQLNFCLVASLVWASVVSLIRSKEPQKSAEKQAQRAPVAVQHE